ncbi:MAG: hypothetical protein CMJ48_00440 [Planctomycetaceae bacterium]|nr:hypothetical protein [Planctomycetaceae bacterium]
MSDWDAVYDQGDFFLQDEPPNPRISVRLIVAAALIGFALLIAAAVFLVDRALRQNELSEANRAIALAEANETTAREFDADAIRRGFSLEASVSPELAAEFKPLFEAFLKAANTDDRLIYRRIVDFPAFLDHVDASPFGGQLDDYSRRELTTTARESVSAAEGWQTIQIRQIVDDTHSPGKVIYADALNEDGYSNPIRLWVVRNSGGWKLSDWQTVEQGVRESEDLAIYIAYEEDVYSEYYYGWEALNSAGDLFADDDHETGLTRARAIRTSKRIPLMHDRLLVDLAYLFLEWSENDDALKTLERVTRPEMFPGVFVVRSQALEQLGRHEEAAEVAEHCIARYGNLIEPLRTLVTCRAALQRDAQAQHARRALLGIVPDDMDILREYALGLHDDEKTLLTEHVLRLRSGDDVAFTLARTLAAYDDADGVAALREAARRQQPDSPRLAFFDALMHTIDGEWEQVAAICGRLLDAEQDEEWREIIERELLSALIYSEKPREILQASRDKEKTLQYVADTYFEGDMDWSDDEFTEFVKAYRQDNPKDPWGAYYLAQAQSDQEQGDKALEALAVTERLLKARQTAEKQSDHDEQRQDAERLQASIRYLRLRILHENGRALEAYRTIEPPEDTFLQLAAMFRYADENSTDLQALFEAHRAKFPDDPWLTFHEAVQAEKDGELGRADALLTRLLHKQDDGLRWHVLALWNDVQCQQGEFVGALRNTPQPESTMAAISTHLTAKKEYETLEHIAHEFARLHPNQPTAIVYQVAAIWEQRDYARVVKLFTASPRALDELGRWQRSTIEMRLIRSHLRLGQHVEAARVIDAMETGDMKRLANAIVDVVSDDIDATLQSARLLSSPWNSSGSLYKDEDAGTLLYGPDFRKVRDQVPPPLSSSWYGSPGVLVFAKEDPERRQTVQDAIRRELGEDVVIRTLPDPRHPTRTHLVAHNDNAQLVVTLARGLAWGEKPDSEEIESQSLRRIVGEHAAWIQIQPCELPNSERMDFLGRMLASLAHDDCLAVQVSGSLMDANRENRVQLADGLTHDECEALGERCWLYIENKQHDDDESWNRLRRRSLQKLDRAFAKRTDDQEFSLQVRLNRGIASETSWLKLVRVRRSGHRERSFIAAWGEPPLLARRADVGESVWIQPHDVVNWRIQNGDSVQFGREPEKPK